MKNLFKINVVMTFAVIILSLSAFVQSDTLDPYYTHDYKGVLYQTIVAHNYRIVENNAYNVFTCVNGLIFSCATNQCLMLDDENMCPCPKDYN